MTLRSSTRQQIGEYGKLIRPLTFNFSNISRPIPSEMFDYARSDTHFLLYIYDHLRNELLSTRFPDLDVPLLSLVQINSRETALQRYEHPVYDTQTGLGNVGWYKLLSKTPAIFKKEQFAVFRAVHLWRDNLARATDDNPNFIMQNHSLFAIARELPADRTAVFRVVSPISQPVRARIDELVAIVSRAKKIAVNEKEMRDIMAETDQVIRNRRQEAWAAKKTITTHQPQPPQPQQVEQPQQPQQVQQPLQTQPPQEPLEAPPVTQTIVEDKNDVPIPTSYPASLTASQFWGNIAQASPVLYHAHNLWLSIPLPEITAEVFTTAAADQESTPIRPGHEYVPIEDRAAQNGIDDVFIIKQLGGRKRKHAHDRLEDVDLAQMSDMENERSRKKREKKEKKKEKKRKREELTVALDEDDEEQGSEDGEVEEFDYSAAPFLLGTPAAESRKRSKYKKPLPKVEGALDMYSKAMDAPKGLGRANKQRAGVSGVFKNPN
jgi:exosome complex exonuclease RRP6